MNILTFLRRTAKPLTEHVATNSRLTCYLLLSSYIQRPPPQPHSTNFNKDSMGLALTQKTPQRKPKQSFMCRQNIVADQNHRSNEGQAED